MFTLESLENLNSEIKRLENKKIENEESLYKNTYEIQCKESLISELKFLRELDLVNSEDYKSLKNQQQRDLALEKHLFENREYKKEKIALGCLVLEKNLIIAKISYLKAEIASKKRFWDWGILSLSLSK